MKKIIISLKIDPDILSVLKLFAKWDENSVSGIIRKTFKNYIKKRWKKSSNDERKKIEEKLPESIFLSKSIETIKTWEKLIKDIK